MLSWRGLCGVVAVVVLGFFSACSFGTKQDGSELREAWKEQEDPLRFDRERLYQTKMADLPRKGESVAKPWVSTHWPDALGGIAFRWNMSGDGDRSFFYKPPTRDEVLSMTPAELAKLSPAEKFDIYVGRFDYPTLQLARVYGSPFLPFFSGVCDGIAASSIASAEPRAGVLTGPSGIAVPFGSSDVKGLLGYYHARVRRFSRETLGLSCHQAASSFPDEACRDVNPAAFHLVLANEMGRWGRPVIADLEWDAEEWNHAIYGYVFEVADSSAPVAPEAAPGTHQEVMVTLAITHTSAQVGESWEPQPLAENSEVSVYKYILEIDGEDRIIGGRWLSYAHPDIVWRPHLQPYTGDWEALGDIVRLTTSP